MPNTTLCYDLRLLHITSKTAAIPAYTGVSTSWTVKLWNCSWTPEDAAAAAPPTCFSRYSTSSPPTPWDTASCLGVRPSRSLESRDAPPVTSSRQMWDCLGEQEQKKKQQQKQQQEKKKQRQKEEQQQEHQKRQQSSSRDV